MEHQGHRRRGQEVLRRAEEAELPEGRGLPEVPQDVRPDAGGHPAARQARPAVEQDPRQGRQGQGHGLRQGDRRLLQQEQGPLRPAREARPARRADQGARPRPTRPRPRSSAATPGRPSPRSTRSTTRRRPPAASCPAQAKGTLDKELDDAVFSAKKNELDRPDQDPVRLLRLRRHRRSPRPASRRSPRPRRRSSRRSSPRTSRRRWTPS